MQNSDILWGGKWDHWESENLPAICALPVRRFSKNYMMISLSETRKVQLYNSGRCGKMLISTIKRVQIACNYDFLTPGGPIYHKLSKFCTQSFKITMRNCIKYRDTPLQCIEGRSLKKRIVVEMSTGFCCCCLMSFFAER